MSLTDLIEEWLHSRQFIGWKIDRIKPTNYLTCDYIICRDHTFPMTVGDDYVIAIFDTYVSQLANPDDILHASDPKFLDKLWTILDHHYNFYHL